MKTIFALGTISTGGKNEVRIYIKSPFDKIVEKYLGKGAIVLLLVPETEEEEKIVKALRAIRIQI